MSDLEARLKETEAQLEVAEAQTRLVELRKAAPFPYETEEKAAELARAEQELEYANKVRTRLQRGVSREAAAQAAQERAQRGAETGAEKAAREARAVEATLQTQRELEARQGADLGGWRYPMITETQRLVRENPTRIVVTKSNQKQLRKDPERVLRGIRSRITDLEAAIKEKMDRTRGFLIDNHPDAKRYNDLQIGRAHV